MVAVIASPSITVRGALTVISGFRPIFTVVVPFDDDTVAWDGSPVPSIVSVNCSVSSVIPSAVMSMSIYWVWTY